MRTRMISCVCGVCSVCSVCRVCSVLFLVLCVCYVIVYSECLKLLLMRSNVHQLSFSFSFSVSLFSSQVAVSNQVTTSRLGGVRIEVRDAEESLLLCEHTTAEADGIASWTQEGTSGQHLLITAWKPG